MSNIQEIKKSVIKDVYFSNWTDQIGYPLAFFLLPLISKFNFITPNVVTLFSFLIYSLGSFLLFIDIPYHFILATFLVFSGYVGDDLDGQLARFTKKSSAIGDFLDKNLDVLKIFIITFSLGLACYLRTNNIIYIFLAFAACFFFMFRYYIKLETMFAQIDKDKAYLEKSSKKREEIIIKMQKYFENYSKSLFGKVKIFLIKNRTIFFIDEAEFVVVTSAGALLNNLEVALVILATSQVIIGFYRFFERGYQISLAREYLLRPMRK